MYLKKLVVSNADEVIREVTFQKGLNLIIDETNLENKQESGNNVGKTTVLRLVDYCLGSNGKSIYQDSEFKDKTNTLVEKFLKNNDLLIKTIFINEFSDNPEKEIIIERNFKSRFDHLIQINGETILKKDFQSELKKHFFDTSVEKPSFRQIISRNIRDEKGKLNNTIKVLHPNVTLEEYEAIYFFWFGIDTDSSARKLKLTDLKKSEEKLLKRLKKERSRAELEQALSIIERDIDELEAKKETFNLDDDYEKELNDFRELRNKINSLSQEISTLGLRRDIILESRSNLQSELQDIDTDQLRELYGEAQEKLGQLNKDFEDLLDFHNDMINDRLSFIDEQLPKLDDQISSLNIQLNEYLSIDQKLASKIYKGGALEELEIIIQKLNEKYELKGRVDEQIMLISKSEDKLERIDSELGTINEDIDTVDEIFKTRIKAFNKYFSEISKLLYDEQFILVPEKDDRAYKLKITNVIGNPGTGKKKGQIAAFDLAYIQFCQEYEIPCLQFIMHDQIENIHGNQLDMLSEITNSINAQFIAPVLRDKLPSTIDIDLYKVLTLSESDKLLKLEG